MSKRWLFISFFTLFCYAIIFSWTEATLVPPEPANTPGINDTTATAGAIGTYNGAGILSGTGYIATNTDVDYYSVTITGMVVNRDILKIQLGVPPNMNNGYGLTFYDGTMFINSTWADSGNTGTCYVDISKYDGLISHTFFIEVYSNGASSTINAYTVQLSLLDTGKIPCQVSLVGVGASGLTNVNVSALDINHQQISTTITSGTGSCQVNVPVGVSITALSAVRQWYPSCTQDWAYGRTEYALSPSVFLTSAGQVATPVPNLKVYKEGVVSGAILSAVSNVDINIYQPYNQNNQEANLSNTNTAYAVHNLPPGAYCMWAQPHAGYGTNQTVSYTANVNVRDGFVTTINYSFGVGYNVTGTISPPPPTGSTVQVMRAGTNHNGEDMYSRYFRVPVTGNTYAIKNLPADVYDFYMGNGGPSGYLPVLGQSIPSGPNIVNFNGPNPVTFIAGTVTDNTHSFSQIAVYALVSGTPDVFNQNLLGYAAMCDTSWNFNIPVPADFKYYDLIALAGMAQNGPPMFIGWKYDAVTGTSNNLITVNNGISVSGAMTFNGNPVSQYDRNAQVEIFRDMGGGNYKLYDMGKGTDSYQGLPYLISGTPYTIIIRANGVYFNASDISTTLNASSLTGQNFNMTVNPATDLYNPYAGYMEPCHQGMLLNGSDSLYFVAGDYALGTGINTVSINSDTAPVVPGSGVKVSDNTFRYQFQLPASQQTPGTAHDILITVSDLKGNVYNTIAPWHVVIATGTITPTWTVSPVCSPTRTYTISPTYTRTSAATPTYTFTYTVTSTRTLTCTATPTFTVTCTYTQTFTATVTPTVTDTPTSTATPTITPTTPPCSISGTITLPAVSNGKQWIVVVDNDISVTNGGVASDGGTTINQSQISYNVSVSPGTYYIYAFVDENGSGLVNGPDSGDYVGLFGATWLTIPPSPNAQVSCPAGGVYNITAMSGMLVGTPTPTPVYSLSDTGEKDSFVYPQPAKDNIKIVFALSEDADVTIYIFDIAGNRVKTDGKKCYAGKTVELSENVGALRPGPYYYLLRAKTASGAEIKYNLNKFILKQ